MTAPGSRARSREIGYAEAMSEMDQLLNAEAARWQGTADLQLSREFYAALSAAARQIRKLADYAHGAAQVHGTGGLKSLNEFLFEVMWQPWPGETVPAELPQREQSESN